MTATLEYRDTIAVLTLGDDENRFSLSTLDAVEAHLDHAEKNAKALVTAGTGKFYSNGLDLEWLMDNLDRFDAYGRRVQALLDRVLTFPTPTVAAVTGHAFGAGAMLAIAHDFRVQREDRGFVCLPEVDIRIPFTPGMAALLQAKLLPQTAVTAMTTGHRFAGPDALAAGIVHELAAEDAVVDAAVDRVSSLLGKDADTLGAIKKVMYASVSTALAG